MAVFGVRLSKNKVAEEYFKATHERLQLQDFVNNPFKGYCKNVKNNKEKDDLILVLNMRPLWQNFPPYVALIFAFTLLMLDSPDILAIIPLFFLFMGFFWTEHFFYIMFRIGLKKAGYKGKIKKINKSVLIDIMARRF